MWEGRLVWSFYIVLLLLSRYTIVGLKGYIWPGFDNTYLVYLYCVIVAKVGMKGYIWPYIEALNIYAGRCSLPQPKLLPEPKLLHMRTLLLANGIGFSVSCQCGIKQMIGVGGKFSSFPFPDISRKICCCQLRLDLEEIEFFAPGFSIRNVNSLGCWTSISLLSGFQHTCNEGTTSETPAKAGLIYVNCHYTQ